MAKIKRRKLKSKRRVSLGQVPASLEVKAAEYLQEASSNLKVGRCLSASRNMVKAVYYFGRGSVRAKESLDNVAKKLDSLSYRIGLCYSNDPESKE